MTQPAPSQSGPSDSPRPNFSPKPSDSQASTQDPPPFDVVIAGGGYVGLSLALALRQSCPDLRVMVIDARPAEVIDNDARASAIAAAAIRMLDTLGAWEAIAPKAQPITDMIVTDSRTDDPVRPVYLTFSGDVAPGEPFAHMVPNGAMTAALRARALAAGVDVRNSETVQGYEAASDAAQVFLGSGETVTASLVVAADGARSRLRDMAGIEMVGWMYGQSGIVTTVRHERDHGGRAEEHFLPGGPFAILPLPDNQSSIVWTEESARAERLVKGDAFTFLIELERRFGKHLGKLELVGDRVAFPLGLRLARHYYAERLVLVGDAAHGVHPISGQGLNLGFRDVAALAEILVESYRVGLDLGAEAGLARYERWRRFDTVQMGVVTDVLNRLFRIDNAPLRALRDFGLGLVDRMQPLKKLFIDEAAGIVGELPKLLQGRML